MVHHIRCKNDCDSEREYGNFMNWPMFVDYLPRIGEQIMSKSGHVWTVSRIVHETGEENTVQNITIYIKK